MTTTTRTCQRCGCKTKHEWHDGTGTCTVCGSQQDAGQKSQAQREKEARAKATLDELLGRRA